MSVSNSTRRPVPRAAQKSIRKRARVSLGPTPVPPVLAARKHPLQNGGESSPGAQTRRPLPTGGPAGRGDGNSVAARAQRHGADHGRGRSNVATTQEPTCLPRPWPALQAKRKWRPAWTRESAFSSAAWLKLAKLRGGVPGGAV